jgi:hypothetical protein
LSDREKVYRGGRWWRRKSGKHDIYEVLCVAKDKTADGEKRGEMVVYRPDHGGDGAVFKPISEFLEKFEPMTGR